MLGPRAVSSKKQILLRSMTSELERASQVTLMSASCSYDLERCDFFKGTRSVIRILVIDKMSGLTPVYSGFTEALASYLHSPLLDFKYFGVEFDGTILHLRTHAHIKLF